MGVAPSSATSMLKKLAALGLAEHSPYRGVELCRSGRGHRPRGHPPSPAPRAVPGGDARPSDRRRPRRGGPARARHLRGAGSADRRAARLSDSRSARRPDPRRGLHMETKRLRSLDALEPGEEATVRRVPDGDSELLRYLWAGCPGRRVLLPAPFGGPVTMRRDRARLRRARRPHRCGRGPRSTRRWLAVTGKARDADRHRLARLGAWGARRTSARAASEARPPRRRHRLVDALLGRHSTSSRSACSRPRARRPTRSPRRRSRPRAAAVSGGCRGRSPCRPPRGLRVCARSR